MATKRNLHGGYLPPSAPQNAVAVRARLSGDRVAANALLQNVLKFVVPGFLQSGQFQNLQQNQKRITYPTGETVHLRSVFGTVMVDVFSPPPPVLKRVEGVVVAPKQKIPRHWEDWLGSKDNLCLQHTWRCGMTDPNLERHDWAYCDGSFTLDPPVFDPGYPEVPDHAVVVTDLYWLDVTGGQLVSSFWREPAGSTAALGYINYRSSYLEWQASLDTVGPTAHVGRRQLQFSINTEFTGFPEGDYLPNTSFVAVELADTNSNFVRLYFKADPAYLTAIGQSAYLVGDGLVNIAFEDWGLDSDLASLLLLSYSDFSQEDRVVNYQCDYIDLL